jgi:hypothetical protein
LKIGGIPDPNGNMNAAGEDRDSLIDNFARASAAAAKDLADIAILGQKMLVR